VPVSDGNEDRWHREAFDALASKKDGTYELMGPKVQGNLEGYPEHVLLAHAETTVLTDCPRSFVELREYLVDHAIEGIVWHHDDGRMVKIKGKDFGIKRHRAGTTILQAEKPARKHQLRVQRVVIHSVWKSANTSF